MHAQHGLLMQCWACNCIPGSKTSVLWQTPVCCSTSCMPAMQACFMKHAPSAVAGKVCHRSFVTEVLLPRIQLHAQQCMCIIFWQSTREHFPFLAFSFSSTFFWHRSKAPESTFLFLALSFSSTFYWHRSKAPESTFLFLALSFSSTFCWHRSKAQCAAQARLSIAKLMWQTFVCCSIRCLPGKQSSCFASTHLVIQHTRFATEGLAQHRSFQELLQHSWAPEHNHHMATQPTG